ncbi:MAG: tRNA (adenosine(37)-N6)-dimethylallyltransferase MiaA [Candidatus Moranbacteria bacterium]|nr:tRNA (adenosine(37)-N6)-dimethylallyltransferase MiaA [Candidatus Moranbacteria bacterium]
MPKSKPKIIVIMGPTASGKSGVAIELAKKFNGEIISADSRQIYKGMDLGTGKIKRDIAKEKIQDTISNQSPVIRNQKKVFVSEGITHYLIDIVEPQENFNVSHFKKAAEEKITEIISHGKVPIICGGTAFWIDALTKDIELPEVLPNENLRAELEKLETEELFTRLEKLDPERAKNIDAKNKVRLVRAIEICETIGKVPAKSLAIGHQSSKKYDFLEIGIEVQKEILNEKIKKRLDERFESGMTQEVENLHKKGVSWKWMERIGLEYRWIARFLQNQISETEMREKLYFAIIHYAKRQMTWLKKNPSIIWHGDYKDIEKEVEKFLE